MEKCGTAPKLNLTESSFIKISTSNPEHSLFRFMILILEFNMFHNILFINHFHKRKLFLVSLFKLCLLQQ